MATVVYEAGPVDVTLTKSPDVTDVGIGLSITLIASFQFTDSPLAVYVQWYKQDRTRPIWTATASYSLDIQMNNSSKRGLDFPGLTGAGRYIPENSKRTHAIRFKRVDFSHAGSYYCVLTYWGSVSKNDTAQSNHVEFKVIGKVNKLIVYLILN